ncbi:hypothetical protein KKD42_03545, partial [Patescibacteria group bacterium]|nr:hypothetical protein [Patescibacteria group bacterium]
MVEREALSAVTLDGDALMRDVDADGAVSGGVETEVNVTFAVPSVTLSAKTVIMEAPAAEDFTLKVACPDEFVVCEIAVIVSDVGREDVSVTSLP